MDIVNCHQGCRKNFIGIEQVVQISPSEIATAIAVARRVYRSFPREVNAVALRA